MRTLLKPAPALCALVCSACQIIAGLDTAEVGAVHVPGSALLAGTCDLELGDGATIDTSELAVMGGTVCAPLDFAVRPQVSFGGAGGEALPALAILYVNRLTVARDATVLVRGSRPLVILAGDEVIIAGTLDASATRDEPGPHGQLAGQGSGAGTAGAPTSSSGGGGAGHAISGGQGGDAQCGGGDASGCPGFPVGVANVEVLAGGAGGGNGGDADGTGGTGGAGGGAIEIFARRKVSITADGVITVGGGGGQGGQNGGAGGGGGAGGMIVLQAPTINHDGLLAANGGGGGGGSTAGQSGMDGDNGLTGTPRAAGGDGSSGNDGGAGASIEGLAGAGSGTPGGGGGGAFGRVALLTRKAEGLSNRGTNSPTPFISTY